VGGYFGAAFGAGAGVEGVVALGAEAGGGDWGGFCLRGGRGHDRFNSRRRRGLCNRDFGIFFGRLRKRGGDKELDALGKSG